ncbi:MAG: cytochrome c-type biogenesis protein CcmH [Gammaproteobacteria bacterium]|nr:cytochrome c-type biogenesis protein CcmH [Gammaproteobacteria bacterium]
MAVIAGSLLIPMAMAMELREFASAEDEARYRGLLHELRCLVCQNQSLADSDAQLAQDLRREVFEMIAAGEPDDAITAFMVARYGDFVLYRPPFKPLTAALWLGPPIFAAIGFFVLFKHIRKRRPSVKTGQLSAAEHAKLDALLSRNKESA